MARKQNILISILILLNIKHNKWYANRMYERNPHNHTLFGIAELLDAYNINCEAYLIEKEKFGSISTPFVAETKTENIIIMGATNYDVELIHNGKTEKIKYDLFLEIWTGVVLFFEKANDSKEPNYIQNKVRQITKHIFTSILLLFILTILVDTLYISHLSTPIYLLLTVNSIGLIIIPPFNWTVFS